MPISSNRVESPQHQGSSSKRKPTALNQVQIMEGTNLSLIEKLRAAKRAKIFGPTIVERIDGRLLIYSPDIQAQGNSEINPESEIARELAAHREAGRIYEQTGEHFKVEKVDGEYKLVPLTPKNIPEYHLQGKRGLPSPSPREESTSPTDYKLPDEVSRIISASDEVYNEVLEARKKLNEDKEALRKIEES